MASGCHCGLNPGLLPKVMYHVNCMTDFQCATIFRMFTAVSSTCLMVLFAFAVPWLFGHRTSYSSVTMPRYGVLALWAEFWASPSPMSRLEPQSYCDEPLYKEVFIKETTERDAAPGGLCCINLGNTMHLSRFYMAPVESLSNHIQTPFQAALGLVPHDILVDMVRRGLIGTW